MVKSKSKERRALKKERFTERLDQAQTNALKAKAAIGKVGATTRRRDPIHSSGRRSRFPVTRNALKRGYITFSVNPEHGSSRARSYSKWH